MESLASSIRGRRRQAGDTVPENTEVAGARTAAAIYRKVMNVATRRGEIRGTGDRGGTGRGDLADGMGGEGAAHGKGAGATIFPGAPAAAASVRGDL